MKINYKIAPLLFLLPLWSCSEQVNNTPPNQSVQSVQPEQKAEEPKQQFPSVGDIYIAEDFELIVDSFGILKSLDLKMEKKTAGEDEMFVVIAVTYKNTSSINIEPESGSLVVYEKDKDPLEYSETERIFERGWTLFIQGIGPRLKGNIKYAYKVPVDSKGKLLYMPVKSLPKRMIYLGDL